MNVDNRAPISGFLCTTGQLADHTHLFRTTGTNEGFVPFLLLYFRLCTIIDTLKYLWHDVPDLTRLTRDQTEEEKKEKNYGGYSSADVYDNALFDKVLSCNW